MSKNKSKKPYSSDSNEEDSPSQRVVAIPKDRNAEEGNSGGELRSTSESTVVFSESKTTKQKYSSDHIGDVLREARLRRGDDLYLIAEYLCIKPTFLIALENSRYDEFPADAYVIGFLRSYANFLDIDGKEAVDRYRYEMAGRRKKPILSMPTPVSEGRIPSAIVIVGVVIALIVIYSLWYSFSSSDRAEIRIPPPLPTTAQTLSSDSSSAAGLTAPVSSASTETTAAPMSTIPPASPGIIVTADKLTPAPKAEGTENKEESSDKKAELAKIESAALEAKKAEEKKLEEKRLEEKKLEEKKAEEKRLLEEKKLEEKKAEEKKLEEAAKVTSISPISSIEVKPEAFGVSDGSSRVVIRAMQDSWVMVVDESGTTLFDRVLKTGDVYNVPDQSGLSLTTGNGGGIVLSVDGKELPKVYNGPPRMVRNITLDPNRLMATYGSR
ncbi:MAG: RodZ domain-containing protein [Bdellovibrionales bacterium]